MVHTKIDLILPFSVLITSFLGSSHCAFMCGGLVAHFTTNWYQFFKYQVGRLLGYLSLGGLLGYLGSNLFSSLSLPFQWGVGLLFLALLIGGVISHLLGKNFHLPGLSFLYQQLTQCLRLIPSFFHTFFMGFFSAFLPCGYLYTFVLSAVFASSAKSGAIILSFFWLGTLPALTIPHLFKNLLSKTISPRYLVLLSVSSFLIGVVTLGVKFLSILSQSHHCH